MSRTRPVRRQEARRFLAKATEFLETAEECLGSRRWDAAALNAVHATISALDALCGHFLQLRSADSDHHAAIDLALSTDVPQVRDRLRGAELVLSRKNLVEYEARQLLSADAETLVKQAKRVETLVSPGDTPSGRTGTAKP